MDEQFGHAESNAVSKVRTFGNFALAKKDLAIAVVACFAAMLSSCAQPARQSLMAAPGVMGTVVVTSPVLKNSISISEVTGGKETNPMWTSQVNSPEFKAALELSLRNNVMLADNPSDTKYLVSAQLIDLKQPLIGIDMTVTSKVNYRVVEKSSRNEVFYEEVTTPFTANFGSAIYGPERLRLANEGAIRENIQKFITRFVESWLARNPAQSKQSLPPTS